MNLIFVIMSVLMLQLQSVSEDRTVDNLYEFLLAGSESEYDDSDLDDSDLGYRDFIHSNLKERGIETLTATREEIAEEEDWNYWDSASIVKGLKSSNVLVQSSCCHYLKNVGDDSYIGPVMAILRGPNAGKILPKENDWGESMLGEACFNSLVEMWNGDEGTSKAAWDATIEYINTIPFENVPRLDELSFGMYANLIVHNAYADMLNNNEYNKNLTDRQKELLRELMKEEEVKRNQQKGNMKYYNADQLVEGVFGLYHRGLISTGLSEGKMVHVLDKEFVKNISLVVQSHKPEYVAYMLIDQNIPVSIRREDIVYDVEKSSVAKKKACELVQQIKQGKEIKDPMIKKLGIRLTPIEAIADTYTENDLKEYVLKFDECKSE